MRPGTALPLLARAVDSFYGVNNPQLTDLSDVDGEARSRSTRRRMGRSRPRERPVSASGTGWTDAENLDVTMRLWTDSDLPGVRLAGNPTSCYDDDRAPSASRSTARRP